MTTFWLYMAHADTNNNLIKAIAIGCGNQVLSNEVQAYQVDELAACYQKGIHEFHRKRLKPFQMAFHICSAFQDDINQYICLNRYKDEARDPEIYKIFNSCASSKTNLLEKSLETLSCLKTKNAESKADTRSTLLEKGEVAIQIVENTCGKSHAILYTNQNEVEELADCYQTALLKLEDAPPSQPYLALELCDNFKLNVEKINCIHRSYSKPLNEKMKTATESCLKQNDQKLTDRQKTKAHSTAQKKYAAIFDCIRDEFQLIISDSQNFQRNSNQKIDKDLNKK